MARIIPLSVCVYIVAPGHQFFHRSHVPRMINALLNNIAQPHEIRMLDINYPYKVKIVDLKPLTRTLNIVIIPDKKFIFDLHVHSESIILIVSIASGNADYCTNGIYAQAVSLVGKYLSGVPVSTKRRSQYANLQPRGRAIVIASMVDVVDVKEFDKLYWDACTIKLIRRQRNALIHTVLLKKKLYLLNKERFDARNAVL